MTAGVPLPPGDSCASDAALCVPAHSVNSLGMFFWIIDLWLLVTMGLALVFAFYCVFGADRAESGWRRYVVRLAGFGAAMFTLTGIVTFAGLTVAVWLR